MYKNERNDDGNNLFCFVNFLSRKLVVELKFAIRSQEDQEIMVVLEH